MEYISTRNKKLNLSFKDVFLRGLAPDGGLFIPREIKTYNQAELKSLSKMSYDELATEIIGSFCSPELDRKHLSKLVKKSYANFTTKDVVVIKKVGDINLVELYHGPTLAFKDIAMQVIGNMYDEFKISAERGINIVVATSGDTGSAAISALNDRKNINVFVLHPHNKISNIQRKIMTTIGSNNIYNIAIKGTFDDCQKIVKDMFSDNIFREKINLSAVNSINWARIICQVVYYFYSAFKFQNKKISFSVPTGNFGDIYAGYVAKKMGLPINKLLIATNSNDILKRAITSGIYKPLKVEHTISPSMDIQVASNFERLIFDVYSSNANKTLNLMQDLNTKGEFIIGKEELERIKESFCSASLSEKETKVVIRDIYKNYGVLIDPHTAVAVGAIDKIAMNENTIILATAHPSKFSDVVMEATNIKPELPENLENILVDKEKYEQFPKDLEKVKNYILDNI